MEKALECSLSVAPRLQVGEPVNVHFRLTNRTAQPLYVLTWRTPLEGLLGNDFTVTLNGEELPYEGPMMKRGDPRAEDYVAVAPGASADATVDLSLAWPLTKPGSLRIAFRGEVMDVATSQAEVPHPLAQLQPQTVQCPVLEATLMAP